MGKRLADGPGQQFALEVELPKQQPNIEEVANAAVDLP
jgi:hypothetical protein